MDSKQCNNPSCLRAGESLALSEFPLGKNRCRRCYAERSRAYRAANLSKVKESQRRWRELNRQKVLEIGQKYRQENREKERIRGRKYYRENTAKALDSQLKSRYGITKTDFEILSHGQGNVCAICRYETRLVVDHDHKTGIVRGLLCQGCNLGLGKFKDNPDLLLAAIRYLTQGGEDDFPTVS